jgi:hypothetical protein
LLTQKKRKKSFKLVNARLLTEVLSPKANKKEIKIQEDYLRPVINTGGEAVLEAISSKIGMSGVSCVP